MPGRSPADRPRRESAPVFDAPRTTDGRAPRNPRRVHLEELGRAVERVTGFSARVVEASPSAAVVLHVVNPAASDLSEDITCDLRDGEWWYVWSWGDVIAVAHDAVGAAKAVRHVLAVQS